MSSRLEQALAEAADIEAAEHASSGADSPLPSHVRVSQPGRARSRVLQVRLNPEELAALEAIAERRALPVSTVARAALLRFVAEEADPDDRLAQLVEAADRIRSLAGEVRADLGGRASPVRGIAHSG